MAEFFVDRVVGGLLAAEDLPDVPGTVRHVADHELKFDLSVREEQLEEWVTSAAPVRSVRSS